MKCKIPLKGAIKVTGRDRPTAALIFGGRGMEHDVSINGAKFVFPLIDEKIFKKIPVYISKDGKWLMKTDVSGSEGVECFPVFRGGVGGLITSEGFIPVDVAFPLLHGDFGEDGTVQGALENAMIPYVGCDVATGAIARDKGLVKLIARELGILTAKWIEHSGCTEESVWLTERLLGYPVFVKPSRLGSSVGVSCANNSSELYSAIENASHLGKGRVIIEEAVEVIKELECAYYSASGKILFTSPGEVVCDLGFYDFNRKYLGDGASVSEISNIDKAATDATLEYSKKLAKRLGLRHISRIDFFLSTDGKVYFNEVNTMPGFTERSLYPRLLLKEGIPSRELVLSLLNEAMSAP